MGLFCQCRDSRYLRRRPIKPLSPLNKIFPLLAASREKRYPARAHPFCLQPRAPKYRRKLQLVSRGNPRHPNISPQDEIDYPTSTPEITYFCTAALTLNRTAVQYQCTHKHWTSARLERCSTAEMKIALKSIYSSRHHEGQSIRFGSPRLEQWSIKEDGAVPSMGGNYCL